MVDALVRVATAALSVPARVTVANAREIEEMVSDPSAATAQLGLLCQRVLLAGDRLVLADIPRTTARVAADHGARSFAGLPLLGEDGSALGVLVATTEQPGALCEPDLTLLADVALGAAAALACLDELAATKAEAESLRKLIDQSPSIIGRRKLDGTPTYVSAAAKRVLGYDPAELLAVGARMPVHPDDAAMALDCWRRAVKGEPTVRDIRVCHRDGSWRTMRMSTQGVRGPDGSVEEIRYSARDVTAETAKAREIAAIQAEAAHRQALLDTILETIDVGVVACDADGNRILTNRAAREMSANVATGEGSGDWPNWAVFEADGVTPFPVQDRPLTLALRGEQINGIVATVPQRDGSTALVRCDARQLRDADGTVTGAVSAYANITELARTSDALREARDRAEAIIATVIDGFISAGADGVVREWNPAAERITGWTAQEAIGRTVSELIVPPEERAYLEALFAGDSRPQPKLVGSGLTRQMMRKDGSPIMVELTSWNTSHRGELRYNAFMRDVTESQAAAAAIAAAHAEFTAALDAMPRSVTLASVVRDENGEPERLTFRWCNRFLLQLMGQPLAELAGRDLDDLAVTFVDPEWHREYLEVARAGVPVNTTKDRFNAGEFAGTFELVITPLDPDTLLIEATDITEQVLAKRDLERSERMLSVSNRAAGMGSSSLDLITGQWTWSRQTFEMFGLNPDTDEIPDAETFRKDIVHPDDVAIYDKQWADIMAGRPQSCEYRIRRPDGQIRHVLNWSDVETDAEGNVIAVVLGAQDQTDRAEREIALARSRELEGLVVDRSPIGIAFLDEAGRYLQVNNALCHMLGRTSHELLSSNFLDITHPDERAGGLSRHRDLIAGKTESFAQDKRYLHANGRELWVSVHKTVLQSSDEDHPVRVLSQIIDISKRQEQTDELTRQARTDALTGLANRRGWEPRLQAALADSLASDRPLTVAILDLDKFKTFNDTFGHPVGDQLLAETSRAWRAHLIRKAPSALLARLGGEEFGVLLPNTDAKKARALLETMIRLVTREQSASAGYSLARPDDDARTLMTRADNALYAAKNNGRARVEAAQD